MKRFALMSYAVLVIYVLAFVCAPVFGQAAKPAPAQQNPATPADQPETGGSELLRLVDLNNDGLISQNEWDDFFADHDRDGDKRLTQEEIQSSLKTGEGEESQGSNYGRLAAFQRLDKNGNDAIDASEWPGKAKDFQYLDANHDGAINREEFLSRNGRWWNMPFENLDLNGDKVIVRSEWLDSKASFDRLDRDQNGAIDRREFYRPR